MKTKTKIIVIGCAAIALLTVLRFIPGRQGGNHVWPNSKDWYVAPDGTGDGKSESNAMSYKKFVDHVAAVRTDARVNPPIQTVLYFDPRGSNEVRMIQKMTETLATLGIEKDERTVSKLVLARVKADWSNKPMNGWDSPDWASIQATALKRKIGYLLPSGTNADGQLIPADALTIKRVLECDLGGPTVPPMENFEVETLKESAQ